MDRLTFEGDFCTIAMCRENPCPYDNSCTQREVWERLKAYEDTGMEPEEVAALREQESNCPEIEAIKGVDFDQFNHGWIPVAERLPENDNEVLTASGQTVQILFYDHDDADWYTVDSDISVHLFCDNVTHWMPLPEPPKEV